MNFSDGDQILELRNLRRFVGIFTQGDKMTKPSQQLETKLIHAGEPHPRILGAVSMPIFQSANFEHGNEADYHSIKYIRLNNTPNHIALHEKLAAVENAEAALVTA